MSLVAAGLFIGSQRLAGLDQAAEPTAATA
jgi:hypothetical protein